MTRRPFRGRGRRSQRTTRHPFTAVTGSVKRKLLAAFFGRTWVDDHGHLLQVTHESPLVADIRDAILNGLIVPTNKKSAGDISDASSFKALDLYLKATYSSNTRGSGSGA